MSIPSPVAIVGLGLMGGSLARDLASRQAHVIGWDADPASLAAAAADGIIHTSLDASLGGIEAAQIVVLATPVDATARLLDSLASRIGGATVVTDLGSTKAGIIEEAMKVGLGPNFVGSHPLAGDHRSGWTATRTDLYAGALVFLCPTSATTATTLERVERLWVELGARCKIEDAAEHDRRMAWISHLPQLLASALAVCLDEAGCDPAELGPGGRDMTRLAGSSPEMWAAICAANAGHLTLTLRQLQHHLTALEEALRGNDSEALLDFFRRGRNWLP